MIYVTSDLHGYPVEKFRALLAKAEFSEEDYCFVLGDVIDRGPEGVELLKWLMDQPNIELILGNHEAMLLACSFVFKLLREEGDQELDYEAYLLYMNWMNNGGGPTMEALAKCDPETAALIEEYLRGAPLYDSVRVGDREFLLVHGGLGSFDPKKPLSQYKDRDLLWTRPELHEEYFRDITTILGHTPTEFYGEEYAGKALFTPTWINIDTGAACGRAPMLLRLEDMKEFYADSVCN